MARGRRLRGYGRRVRARARAYRPHIIIAVLVLLFLLVFLAPRIFIVIGPGEVGVLYRPFGPGTVVDQLYDEGMQVIFPWNRMYIYNTRVQETKRTLEVLTRDGLEVRLDISIRYRPEASTIGLLHKEVGPDYVDKIVVPEVSSVIRSRVGHLLAEQLYTTSDEATGQEVEFSELDPNLRLIPTPTPTPTLAPGATGAPAAPAAAATPAPSPTPTPSPSPSPTPAPTPAMASVTLQDIVKDAVDEVSQRYVFVDDVLIMKAVIPEVVQNAIQEKLRQKEMIRAQLYRERQAAIEILIKRNEAAANAALAGSLTPDVLRWRGIEATKDLATSPNSKVIVIGSGPDGLPIILGQQ